MSHDKNIYNQDPDWHSSRRSPQAVERGASARPAKTLTATDVSIDNPGYQPQYVDRGMRL